MTFGERLVMSREAIGYSQKQLAEFLGITPTRLNYWEKDKRQPDVEMIKALSSALNVSADYLIDNSANAKKAPSISPEARKIAEQYDNLDSHGKRMVDFIIDEETARMQTEQNTIRIYRAANSIDHAAPRIEERSASDMEKLRKATPVTSEDNL